MSSIHLQAILASKMGLAFGLPGGFSTSAAVATPHAAGWTKHTGTTSFVLNEASGRVKVIFHGGIGANDPRELPKGVRSFSRGTATDAAGHNPFSLDHAA